jgi:hypothetical protein
MLGNFACARFRFVLEPTTPLRFSRFAGSTLRGGFGHAFKRAVCLWPPGDCSRCLLKATCAYPYVFETAPPPGSEKLRTVDQVPRPFVLEPPTDDAAPVYQPGQRLSFRLVLVGRGLDYLPYFLFTFSALGRTGLGPGRGQFRVLEVHAEGPSSDAVVYREGGGILPVMGHRVTAAHLACPPGLPVPTGGPTRLTVRFLTPARVISDGVIRAHLNFQDLVRALLRRLSSLCYFHCGSELTVDFKCLIEEAGAVRTADSELRWHGQERFSGRQRRNIEMGGVVGAVTFEGSNLSRFLPLLAAGEWVHVGKGCVMGLGKYQVSAEKDME